MVSIEKGIERSGIGESAYHKLLAVHEGGCRAGGQVIEDHHVPSRLGELSHYVTPDVTRTAGNQYWHFTAFLKNG
jgi:hypothetical protein